MGKNIIFAMFCILPLLIACDKSDDVSDIFVGKTWQLNYIATGSIGKTWYDFDDVTTENLEEYTTREKIFTLSFSGTQSGSVISGTFTGSGSLSAGGNWKADGSSRDFTMSNVYGTPEDASDVIAQKILDGLQSAKSYKGDIDNLYIYFDYEGKSLFMAFSQKQ